MFPRVLQFVALLLCWSSLLYEAMLKRKRDFGLVSMLQGIDNYLDDDLEKWVQWEIWQEHWVWIGLTHMWLELVSFDSPADYPHEYKFVRKINFNEQISEVRCEYYDPPVVQVRRSNATGSSSSSSAAKRRRLV